MTDIDSDTFGVSEIFTEYNEHLEREAEVKERLREVIKELEAGARDIHTLLQRIHRPGGVKDAEGIVTRAREKFSGVSQKYRSAQHNIWQIQEFSHAHNPKTKPNFISLSKKGCMCTIFTFCLVTKC